MGNSHALEEEVILPDDKQIYLDRFHTRHCVGYIPLWQVAAFYTIVVVGVAQFSPILGFLYFTTVSRKLEKVQAQHLRCFEMMSQYHLSILHNKNNG